MVTSCYKTIVWHIHSILSFLSQVQLAPWPRRYAQFCSHLIAGNMVVVKRSIPVSNKNKKEIAYNSKGEGMRYDLAWLR